MKVGQRPKAAKNKGKFGNTASSIESIVCDR